MIKFRVKLTPDDNDTLLVTAPDFPEVITFGKTVRMHWIMPLVLFVK